MYCRIFFSYVLISQISASFSWKHFKILSQKRRWGAWALNKSQIAILKGGCEWGPSSPTPRLRVILIKFLWIWTGFFFLLRIQPWPKVWKTNQINKWPWSIKLIALETQTVLCTEILIKILRVKKNKWIKWLSKFDPHF